jgi:DNA replication protein DnaC
VKTLPALPASVRTLTEDEIERLRKTRTLPASPEDCPTCHGRKTFRWWEKDRGILPQDRVAVDYVCSCVDQFLLHRYLMNSGLEMAAARHRWADLTALSPEVMAPLLEYLNDIEFFMLQGTGLFLHGMNGAGKSMFASLLAKRVLQLGSYTVRYVRFTELLDHYRSSWRDNEQREWFEGSMRNAHLLVLDDMGKEYDGVLRVAMSAVDTIIRFRTQNSMPTIVTTNLDRDDFQTRYAKSVNELVTEACRVSEFIIDSSWRASARNRKEIEYAQRVTVPITFG